MKLKSVLFMILLICVNSSFSQKIEFLDLVSRTKCLNTKCFDQFVVTKGFTLVKSSESPTKVSYESGEKFTATTNEAIVVANVTEYELFPNGKTHASFSTASKEHFAEFMQQLIKEDFTASLSQPDQKGGSEVIYTSPHYPKISVIVNSHLMTNAEKGEWVLYTFTAERWP